MQPFTYVGAPSRVLFGSGTLDRVGEEVRALGCGRALVLSTPQQADAARDLAGRLGGLSAGLFTEAAMHTPMEITERAMQAVQAAGADCTVALGGGSTTGLGKAIALETPAREFPILAIPTTYAGSEMTSIYGLTEAGVKKTGKDVRVLPRTVIYDADLTLSLPVGLSVTSGLNAIAHAAEGLYAQDGNPIMSLLAEEGIRALAAALPRIVQEPRNLEARALAQYGAWLCGTVLGNVGMALHHKLCHTLGGSFNLPHAETHTVVLPHALAYNAAAAPEAMAVLSRVFGRSDPARALYELAARLGAPPSLAALGMPESGIERAADLATQNPYWNPRPLEREAIAALLRRAWTGQPPT